MRISKSPLLLAGAAILALSSCKSVVTAEKVLSQETKATAAVEKAQEEVLKLTNYKERYSVDGINLQIKELEKQQKELKKDIGNYKKMSSDQAKEGAGGMIKGLEKQVKEIDDKIAKLKAIPKENWGELNEQINQQIQTLQNQITSVTQSLKQ